MQTIKKTAIVELTEGDARYVLLALRELKDRLSVIAHNEDDYGEDEHFIAVDDLMKASSAYESIKERAIEVFGEQILNYSQELL